MIFNGFTKMVVRITVQFSAIKEFKKVFFGILRQEGRSLRL